MRLVLTGAFLLTALPAFAQCDYHSAFNYMTGAFEDAPIACTREPEPKRPVLRAENWRQCPTHEERDGVTGQIRTVRVCAVQTATP